MSNKLEFETFRSLGNWERSNLTQKEPSCFNGDVRIRKTRVVFEEVEEPNEVLCERLQKLWDYSDNFHHNSVLQNEAKLLNYELVGHRGNKVVKK